MRRSEAGKSKKSHRKRARCDKRDQDLSITVHTPYRIKVSLTRVYEWSITFGSWVSNLAKPASDWLEKKLARGKLWENPRDER